MSVIASGIILVSVHLQMMTLQLPGKKDQVFGVSTSKYGMGTAAGSMKTPTGNFNIYQKIGNGQPLYEIFVGREPAGIWDQKPSSKDYILTRIMWLNGLDHDNRNTKDRYIYIHGTNQEQLIGSPASHGCVRMKNHDVITLFDQITEGFNMQIHEHIHPDQVPIIRKYAQEKGDFALLNKLDQAVKLAAQ